MIGSVDDERSLGPLIADFDFGRLAVENERDGQLSQDLGMGVQRVTCLVPLFVGQRRP